MLLYINKSMVERNLKQIKQEAYKIGKKESSSPSSVDIENLSHFKETAYFINNIAPELRKLSGYDDKKAGTYQKERKVNLKNKDEKISSNIIYEELIEAFDLGFLGEDLE